MESHDSLLVGKVEYPYALPQYNLQQHWLAARVTHVVLGVLALGINNQESPIWLFLMS